jgi:hypothetical protein
MSSQDTGIHPDVGETYRSDLWSGLTCSFRFNRVAMAVVEALSVALCDHTKLV